MSDVLSFRSERDTRKVLEQIAVFNDITVSELLNQVINDYLIDYRETNKDIDILESLKPIIDEMQSKREDAILKTQYKNRTKDIRTIRTAFYTLYYTKSINRAVDSVNDALDVCQFKRKEQKTNLEGFRDALKNKDLNSLLEYLKNTSSLKKIDQPSLIMILRELCGDRINKKGFNVK